MAESVGLGPLAEALAKARAEFKPITRSRTVKVTMKSGGSYTFAYAPLDTIFEAVGPALSGHGLAVVQLLDGESLVTLLVHESGASLGGRTPLPPMTDIQSFGSAITYLRRYAIQALLGLAAEEDDDGNRAAGNTARPAPAPREVAVRMDEPETVTIEGTVAASKSSPSDLLLRQGPDGPMLGFVMVGPEGKGRTQVIAIGELADDLWDAIGHEGGNLFNREATVTGRLERVPWQKDGKDMPPYRRLRLQRITALGWTLPDEPPEEAESLPLGLEEGAA